MTNLLPAVGAVIVNYNEADTTLACLDALLSAAAAPAKVVVVDNGSADDSPARIRARFPSVEVLANPGNLGFAPAVNAGARKVLAQGLPAFLFLLNNDAFVESATLPTLVSALERDGRPGAAAPKILHGDGRRIWYAGGCIDWKTATGVHHRQGREDDGVVGREAYVEFASGCALLVRTDAIQDGELFDNRYFFMGEDVDLSLRLARAKRPILYVPSALVRHHAGTTSSRQGVPFLWYHMTRNRLLTVEKHASAARKLRFALFWPALWTFKAAGFIARGDARVARAMWNGLVDFRAGRFDKGRGSSDDV